MLWEKVGLDVVHMPASGGFKFIVFARDDLSGWVEGRALSSANSKAVAKFLMEEVISRHGCPVKIVVDGGAENKKFVTDLMEAMRVKRVEISAYHPQSNGLVERGHGPIVNTLSKLSKERKKEWSQYLPFALWADRVAIRRSTGYSAFRLLYGRECILPIELSSTSWSRIDWLGIRTREDLIAARILQLEERNLDEAIAAERLEKARNDNKAYFDKRNRRVRPAAQKLRIGDLVLLHNTAIDTSHNVKMEDRWLGPYRIWETSDSGYYCIEELDGVRSKESVAGNRLKRFWGRDSVEEVEEESSEELRGQQ